MFESSGEAEEELKQIAEEAYDLLEEIVNKERSEIERDSSIYYGAYKKLLKKMSDCFGDTLWGEDCPEYLEELIEEVREEERAERTSSPGVIYITPRSKEITIAERGLKKILKNLRSPLPEPRIKQQGGHHPINIVQSNIQLNSQQQYQLQQLKHEFETEVNKDKPDKGKLLELFSNALKFLGGMF